MQRLKSNALLRGSATYAFSNLLNAGIPFLLLPILTRYLPTEQYGEIAMFQIAATVVMSLVGLSVAGAIGRKYYDDASTAELRDFIGACLQILAVSAVVFLLAIAVFQEPLERYLGLDGRWLYAAWATAVASFVVQIRMTQWQVEKKAAAYGAFQVTQSAVNVSASLALVIGAGQGASGRILAQLGATLLFAVVALFSLNRSRLLGLRWRPDLVREALRFGVPLVPNTLGFLLFTTIDRLVIANWMGLTEAAMYTVGVQIASVFWLMLNSVNNAFVPWLYERLKADDAVVKRNIVKLTYAYFVGVLVVAGLAFALGPLAIRIVAGEKYARAGDVIGWLTLAYAFAGMTLMVTSYIYYSKRTASMAAVTFVTGAINVALTLTLVHLWGMVGAAVAFSIGMALRFLCTWFLAQLRHPMPWFPGGLQAAFGRIGEPK